MEFSCLRHLIKTSSNLINQVILHKSKSRMSYHDNDDDADYYDDNYDAEYYDDDYI